jgi:XTP/dITP diphosphohydrolase
MRRVLLASRNPGKLLELRPLFANHGIDVVDLRDAGVDERPEEEELESFDTFEANALAKARYFFAQSGIPTVADDSGLEVAALGGQPGVHSKRWSGHEGLDRAALDAANNEKLVRSLAGIADRRARYVCAAAYVDGERELVRRGETVGVVLDVPRGGGGFGYDPHFESLDVGATFGEATIDAKERVSHRGRAFRALLAELRVAGSG